MSFLFEQLFGEPAPTGKSTPVTEAPDESFEKLFDERAKFSPSFDSRAVNSSEPLSKAEEWDEQLGSRILAKRACSDRQALACGQRNIGARIERVGSWVKEYDENGNLLCGYVAED